MESANIKPVFMEAAELNKLVADKTPSLKVVNATIHQSPDDGDAILQHNASHIPG